MIIFIIILLVIAKYTQKREKNDLILFHIHI